VHFHKTYRNVLLATLLLAALVQPGAIVIAGWDAPYTLSNSLSIWGEAFVGGSPLLLAYAMVQFLRTRDKRYLWSFGIVVVIVAVVGGGLYVYFLHHWAAADRPGSLFQFVVGCELAFLLSLLSIWYAPLAYLDPANLYNLPLYIAEALLLIGIALLWVTGKKHKEV